VSERLRLTRFVKYGWPVGGAKLHKTPPSPVQNEHAAEATGPRKLGGSALAILSYDQGGLEHPESYRLDLNQRPLP